MTTHPANVATEWKELDADYLVSNDGRIASRKGKQTRLLRPDRKRDGYLQIRIWHNGKPSAKMVHSLVASLFIGPKPSDKHEVNHKNGDRADNRVENLEWVTSSGNKRHRFDILRHGNLQGNDHPNAKITAEQAIVIRRRVRSGETQRMIAADYGITQSNVSMIASGKCWSWLPIVSPQ